MVICANMRTPHYIRVNIRDAHGLDSSPTGFFQSEFFADWTGLDFKKLRLDWTGLDSSFWTGLDFQKLTGFPVDPRLDFLT